MVAIFKRVCCFLVHIVQVHQHEQGLGLYNVVDLVGGITSSVDATKKGWEIQRLDLDGKVACMLDPRAWMKRSPVHSSVAYATSVLVGCYSEAEGGCGQDTPHFRDLGLERTYARSGVSLFKQTSSLQSDPFAAKVSDGCRSRLTYNV